jgi:hypothetical protein
LKLSGYWRGIGISPRKCYAMGNWLPTTLRTGRRGMGLVSRVEAATVFARERAPRRWSFSRSCGFRRDKRAQPSSRVNAQLLEGAHLNLIEQSD